MPRFYKYKIASSLENRSMQFASHSGKLSTISTICSSLIWSFPRYGLVSSSTSGSLLCFIAVLFQNLWMAKFFSFHCEVVCVFYDCICNFSASLPQPSFLVTHAKYIFFIGTSTSQKTPSFNSNTTDCEWSILRWTHKLVWLNSSE